MSDDQLAAAAAALNAPEAIVKRSAEARANADGIPVEQVLAAWAGGTPTAPQEPVPQETVPKRHGRDGRRRTADGGETADGGRRTAAEPVTDEPGAAEPAAEAPSAVPSRGPGRSGSCSGR